MHVIIKIVNKNTRTCRLILYYLASFAGGSCVSVIECKCECLVWYVWLRVMFVYKVAKRFEDETENFFSAAQTICDFIRWQNLLWVIRLVLVLLLVVNRIKWSPFKELFYQKSIFVIPGFCPLQGRLSSMWSWVTCSDDKDAFIPLFR